MKLEDPAQSVGMNVFVINRTIMHQRRLHVELGLVGVRAAHLVKPKGLVNVANKAEGALVAVNIHQLGQFPG